MSDGVESSRIFPDFMLISWVVSSRSLHFLPTQFFKAPSYIFQRMADMSAADWQEIMAWLDEHPQPIFDASAQDVRHIEQSTTDANENGDQGIGSRVDFEGVSITPFRSSAPIFLPYFSQHPLVPSLQLDEPLEPQDNSAIYPQLDHSKPTEETTLQTVSTGRPLCNGNEEDLIDDNEGDLFDDGEEGLFDEEDINGINLQWSDELKTVQDARIFLASLSDKLQTPDVENDDARSIREGHLVHLGEDMLQALVHQPAPPPNELSRGQKDYYWKQQQRTMRKIQKSVSTISGRKIAEGRILVLLDEAINCHIVGLPAKDFKAGPVRKTGYKSLINLTCGERIAKMISCVQQNKMVSLDVLIGSGFEHLIRNPDHYLERKLTNLRSNAKKEEKKDRVREPQWRLPSHPVSMYGGAQDTALRGSTSTLGRKRRATEMEQEDGEATLSGRHRRSKYHVEPAQSDQQLASSRDGETFIQEPDFEEASIGAALGYWQHDV